MLMVKIDDTAGFDNDHYNKQYVTPAVVGEDVHTTYTDYKNKYHS